jgi:serine O-acetyltransferase
MNDPETMRTGERPVIRDASGFAGELYRVNQSFCGEVPSMKETQRWIKDMVSLLFPFRENQSAGLDELETRLGLMKVRLDGLLSPIGNELKNPPEEIVDSFFNELPAAYKILLEDAHTFLKSDPAAEKLEEVILCYPGFFSLVVHRIAHILYNLKVPLLPRVISEYSHGKTGIDIHPGAVLGRNCFIDHGTGIVIGETTLVGDNVKIYQGVTLGALFVEKNMASTKRHPTIGDNVIIYAGATILGGKTLVGHDTIIGGNVWLTESVAPHSIVYRQNKSIIRDSKSIDELNNFVI